VRNATYGWFENINNANAVIDAFSQQDVMNGAIRFNQEGGNGQTPSYDIKVSDGNLDSLYFPAGITFHPSINWLTPILITSGVLGVACLCVTATGFGLITAGGIYIAKSKKYRKSTYDIELETLEGTITLSPFLHKFNIDSSEIKLIEKIGQGGEAAIYLAKWSNKTVAYKVTRIIDASAIAEFETEAKIMLESNHPNIVHVYRICLTPKRIGLVMEFMALGSLKAAIKKKSIRLTWDTLWNIAYDLATVTDFLHKQDIVHRDIKTDNLLLYQEEGEIHAKLADFGLSKRQKVSDASVTMQIGTYKYMAPEMMLGDGHYSEKACDVYAIGMTFVALINQEEPYPKMRGGMFLPGAVGRGERWQKLGKKNYDPAFFKLTNLCRSINPSERPTAKELVKQLKEIEEPLAIFEEDEIFNQALSPPSTLELIPPNEDSAIATKTTAISAAPQTLFSAQPAEKRNSWDDAINILNGKLEKAQNGTLDNTKLETMRATFQKFERLVREKKTSLAQPEQKGEYSNVLTEIAGEHSEEIASENRVSLPLL